jgi:hypothetical protein
MIIAGFFSNTIDKSPDYNVTKHGKMGWFCMGREYNFLMGISSGGVWNISMFRAPYLRYIKSILFFETQVIISLFMKRPES